MNRINPNSKTLSNSSSVLPYFKKALGKDTYNVFSILKEIFVTFLTLYANFLSWSFDKVKLAKFQS